MKLTADQENAVLLVFDYRTLSKFRASVYIVDNKRDKVLRALENMGLIVFRTQSQRAEGGWVLTSRGLQLAHELDRARQQYERRRIDKRPKNLFGGRSLPGRGTPVPGGRIESNRRRH